MEITIIENNKFEDGICFSARAIHKAVGSKRDFTDWFKYKAKATRYIEGVDFEEVSHKIVENSLGGRPSRDWIVSEDMALDLVMSENTDIGFMARKKIREEAKAYRKMKVGIEHNVPRTHIEAVRAYLDELEKNEQLTLQNEELSHEVEVLKHSPLTYTATQVAKDLGFTSAKQLNQVLKALGIQYKQSGTWIPRSGYESWYDIKIDSIATKGTEFKKITSKITHEGKLGIEKLLKGDKGEDNE